MNIALFGGFIGRAEAVINAGQVVVRIGLLRVECNAALQFDSGLGKLALFFE